MRDHSTCLETVRRRIRWHRHRFALGSFSGERPYHLGRMRRLERIFDWLVRRASTEAIGDLLESRPDLADRVIRLVAEAEGLEVSS